MSKLIATNEDNNINGVMMTKHEIDEDSEVRARMAKIKADLHINNIPTLCKSKDQMMRVSNDKRPRLVTLNHQASLNLRELSPSSTATFQRSLHTSNRKNILPNKLTLKSMTVDSSKDYSTSSSSSSDDSSCELNNSNPHQISSARSYTPNSTDILSSSPMSAGLEGHVPLPFSTSVTLNTHSTSSARNRKQLCQSISVDEQPSNVIMMVAPLELAASAPKTMTTTTPCSTLHDVNKINVTSAAPNSSNANDDFAKVEAKVTSAIATTTTTTTTTASADDDVVTVVATTSLAAAVAVTMIPMTSTPGVDGFHLMPDLAMFDLINQTSRQFVLKPATPGLQIKCQIYRQKGIIYPEYKFYLENLDSNLLLLMSARKKKKSKTTCYVISSITFDLNDLEKYVENPLAKLKSNLLGTNFSLYDFGAKPSSNLTTNNNKSHLNSTTTITNNSSITNNNNNNTAAITTATNNNNNSSSQQQLNMTNSPSTTSLPKSESSTTTTRKSSSIDTNVSDETLAYRKEYLSVGYEMNVLGVKGPRQMSVILPGMDSKLNREDFIQHTNGETLSHAWKRIHSTMRSSPLASSPIGAATGLATVTETSPSKTLNGLSGVGNSNKSSSSLGSAASTSKLSSIKRSLFQLSRTQSVEKSSSNKEASIKEEFNNLVRSSSENGSKTAINSTANKSELRNVVKLVNKPPSWHKELNSFALDFHGRVTMASVKNFQIAHEANTEYVVMQFGKCDKDLYTCDYSYPFCALQAFALALTSLDNKLGCD